MWLQVHSVDEIEEFLGVADALVVNVGTLSKEWVQSMRLAAEVASKLSKPWVLDPVGAGATGFRTKVRSCMQNLKYWLKALDSLTIKEQAQLSATLPLRFATPRISFRHTIHIISIKHPQSVI